MNAWLTMVTVVSTVLTLLAHILVIVKWDTILPLMVITVQVSKLLIKINFVRFITDFNECNTNNGGCDHNCINTQGSYQCQCRVGYETNNNGINCTGSYMNFCYNLV